MRVFAIADLHLAISTPQKSMEVFGPSWKNYHSRIKENWLQRVEKNDLVVIPGDITWAMHLKEALIDLKWIDELPGEKLILKGNHDYWWPSYSKLVETLPPSVHAISNNVFNWNEISFGGARLWDTQELDFSSIFEGKREPLPEEELQAQEKIFERELQRLEMSLKLLDKNAKHRIALTHYPPIGLDLKPTRVSRLLEQYNIDICVFGHLHGMKEGSKDLFGTARGVTYHLTSGDYLSFTPLRII